MMRKWYIEIDAFGIERCVSISVWRRFKLFLMRLKDETKHSN